MPFAHSKLNYTYAEAADLLSMSVRKLAYLIEADQILTNGEGKMKRISYAQLDEYILREEQASGFVRKSAA